MRSARRSLSLLSRPGSASPGRARSSGRLPQTPLHEIVLPWGRVWQARTSGAVPTGLDDHRPTSVWSMSLDAPTGNPTAPTAPTDLAIGAFTDEVLGPAEDDRCS